MTLGEKIQELRRRGGMSQDELAEKLDVSRQAVSKWERDEAIPETEKIVRIAQVFQVSTDYLLLGQEEAAPSVAAAAPTSTEPSTGQQVLRGVRRHGYKAGYGMLIAGVALCVLAALIVILVSGFSTGVFDMFGSFTDSAGQMVDDMGFGSASIFDGFFGLMDQQTGQMQNLWTGGARLVTLLVAGPIALVGIALIVGGVVVTIRGKKISRATK